MIWVVSKSKAPIKVAGDIRGRIDLHLLVESVKLIRKWEVTLEMCIYIINVYILIYKYVNISICKRPWRMQVNISQLSSYFSGYKVRCIQTQVHPAMECFAKCVLYLYRVGQFVLQLWTSTPYVNVICLVVRDILHHARTLPILFIWWFHFLWVMPSKRPA